MGGIESGEYDPRETKQYYDEFYETGGFPELPGERQVAEALVGRAGLDPGARVLDVPCGTGKFSEYLADAGLAVTGLDISHTAIRVAARRGVAPLLQGDAVDMPVADDAYDAVFCHGFSLFNEPDLGRLRPFVREVGRVLAPGGTLLWGKTTTHRDESVGSRYDHSRASLEHFFDGFDDLAVTGSFVTVPHLSYVLRGRDLNTPVTAVLERLSSGLGLPTRLYLIVERR